jgi:hypothetical protein
MIVKTCSDCQGGGVLPEEVRDGSAPPVVLCVRHALVDEILATLVRIEEEVRGLVQRLDA